MTTEETLPKIKERSCKRPTFRRFSTRSALRNRERRNSAKKETVPKLGLPELESNNVGGLEWNSELQRQKLTFALEHPNVAQTERSFRLPKDLTAISHRAKFHHQIPNGRVYPGQSPYAMHDDCSHKYFMSGYQGVVPGYRFMLGASYPSLTHDALNDFTNAIKDRNSRLTKSLTIPEIVPQSARSPEDNKRDERISRFLLYRSHTGITPNYKGHIPGHKFRFGRTFGQITKDPLNLESMAYLTAR